MLRVLRIHGFKVGIVVVLASCIIATFSHFFIGSIHYDEMCARAYVYSETSIMFLYDDVIMVGVLSFVNLTR